MPATSPTCIASNCAADITPNSLTFTSLAMTELDDGKATPMPGPDGARANAAPQAPELGWSTAKMAIDVVKKAAPATALTRSPTRIATYPAMGEQIAKVKGRAMASAPTRGIE